MVWVVTWLSVVVLNVDLGLAIGVVFSMMTVICRTQRYAFRFLPACRMDGDVGAGIQAETRFISVVMIQQGWLLGARTCKQHGDLQTFGETQQSERSHSLLSHTI